MNTTMDDVAAFVDSVICIGFTHNFTFDGDAHQARRSDFLVEQPVEIDQQVLGARNTGRDVVVNHVSHAVLVHQAIACGQGYTRLPFLRTDFSL